MPFVAFLVWGFIALLIFGGWAGSGFMYLLARKKHWSAVKGCSAVAFVFFSLTVAIAVFAIAHGLIRSSVPRFVFEDTFHCKPPPGTEVLHGRSSGFADSAGVSLAFRTDRATFDRLRPIKLERVPTQECILNAPSMPTWWRAASVTTEVWVYESSPRTFTSKPAEQNFYSERTTMTWDDDGLVQYDWWGID